MTQKERKIAKEHIKISSWTQLKIEAWRNIVAHKATLDHGPIHGPISDIQDEQFIIVDNILFVEIRVEFDSGYAARHRLVLPPAEWTLSENCN